MKQHETLKNQSYRAFQLAMRAEKRGNTPRAIKLRQHGIALDVQAGWARVGLVTN